MSETSGSPEGAARKRRASSPSVLCFDGRAWSRDLGRELREAPAAGDEAWLRRVERHRQHLPAQLRETLAAMAVGHGPVALHLSGLPQPGALPATPVDCRHPQPVPTGNAEFWLALIGAELGELFSHAEICNGDLFHHIAPQAGEEHAPTGESSRAPLRMHTDGASHPLPPDFVVLWCHRGEHGVATRVAALSALEDAAGPAAMALARRAVFRHRLDYEFRHSVEMRELSALVPLVSDEGPFSTISVDFDFVIPQCREGAALIERLEALMGSVAVGIVQEPGGVLVLDNRRAVHSRDAFEPRYDGTDRWLQAAYVLRRGVVPSPGVQFEGRVAQMNGPRADVKSR